MKVLFDEYFAGKSLILIDQNSRGGRGYPQYQLVDRRESLTKIGLGSWESNGATRAPSVSCLEPSACIIIFSVRAVQHAAETYRRSAGHLPREHPRSRRNFSAASQTSRTQADRTAQRNPADLPGN